MEQNKKLSNEESQFCVAILMASYNGEAYISRQIDSILAQTYQNWRLIIRDDGSLDQTVNIVKQYAKRDRRISIYEDHERLGVPGSFYKLLKVYDQFELYAFSDQDDYWYPEKIERAVSKIKDDDLSIPILYFSDYRYVDSEGRLLRLSPDQSEHLKFTLSLYNSLSSGFVLFFNNELAKLATPEIKADYGEYHDRRFIRTALAFGKVTYDHYVTADHIRYENAVTGANKTKLSLFTNFIKNEFFGSDASKEKQALKEFTEDFDNILKPREKNILDVFVLQDHYLKKLFFAHRLRPNLAGEIAIRILFLFKRL